MYSSSQRSYLEWIPLKTVTATAVLATGAVFYRTLVAEYGWVGTFRYIWEGEPYSPQIQIIISSLNDVEAKREVLESRLSGIEDALDRARLDSVDDASEVRWLPATKDRATKAVVLRWADYYKPRNLEITLGEVSATLDELAAEVDAVSFSETDANSKVRVVQEIKRRKKLLSKQLVLDMERCDAFMTCHKLLNE